MISNLSSLEAIGTGLTHLTTCEHTVSPAQTVVCSLAVSMRKTGMLGTSDRLLQDHGSVPCHSIVTDGTRKGAENQLYNKGRLILSSSELANTLFVSGFSVPWIHSYMLRAIWVPDGWGHNNSVISYLKSTFSKSPRFQLSRIQTAASTSSTKRG